MSQNRKEDPPRPPYLAMILVGLVLAAAVFGYFIR